MYNKVRIAVTSALAITMCTLSSASTLSYFTDTAGSSNDFLVGSASTAVSIYSDSAMETEFDPSVYTIVDGLEIPFYLKAENDGNIPVFQRFRVVMPTGLSNAVELKLTDCALLETGEDGRKVCENTNYSVEYNPSVNDTYAEYYIVRKAALAVSQVASESPTAMFKIRSLSGIDTSAFRCENNDKNSCVLGISAYSDAIQTAGFDDAISAFGNLTEIY